MLESKIEAYLRRRVKEAGGECWKFTSPGLVGVPDRIVFMPEGKVYFCELKRMATRSVGMRASQRRREKRLYELGVTVYVLDSPDTVDYFIGMIT